MATRRAGAVPRGIGFTGHVNDADTGLVYMQRYYDPIAGRFLSQDPVTTDAATGGAFNRYAYAQNNPYRYTDPDGREPGDAAKQTYASEGWTTIFQGSGSGGGMTQSSRATAVVAGAALGGSAGVVAAGVCAVGTGGILGLEAPEIVGAGIAGGALLGNSAADLVDWISSLITSASSNSGNTNPYTGPVSDPVVVVDQKGNAIPVGSGQQVATSPNGDYQQVLGADGRPTGDRLDRGGHKGRNDPAARGPHGHRPGVTTPDGNEHLPIN
jgi:RHS repeat-associated protein